MSRLITRRGVMLAPAAGIAAGLAFNGYAFAYAPGVALDVTRYSLTPRTWRFGPTLKIAVLTDLHFGDPFVSLARLEQIIATTNGLDPDIICLLGDFEPGHCFISRDVPRTEWARALSGLRARLGVHTVLGNHDWWADLAAQRRLTTVPLAARALMDAGLPVYENQAIRLEKEGKPFWLVGLGDQIAYHIRGVGFEGRHDLGATLTGVTDDAPVVLLAHEPDIFAKVPEKVALTLSGHTHGGQVRVLGYSPLVPSRYGNRYAYGHVEENGHHLVVSGGIGPGRLPIRIGVPPEIVLVEVTAPAEASA